jgi:hypothetical protein
MKAALLIASVVGAITLLDLGGRAILYLASSLVFAIGRAAYEQAAHLLGL